MAMEAMSRLSGAEGDADDDGDGEDTDALGGGADDQKEKCGESVQARAEAGR